MIDYILDVIDEAGEDGDGYTGILRDGRPGGKTAQTYRAVVRARADFQRDAIYRVVAQFHADHPGYSLTSEGTHGGYLRYTATRCPR